MLDQDFLDEGRSVFNMLLRKHEKRICYLHFMTSKTSENYLQLLSMSKKKWLEVEFGVLHLGGRVGAAVIPVPFTNSAIVVCEFGSRSTLARAGFLRALRFPPASNIVSSFHNFLKLISGGVP